jgi:aquaporin Z
LIRSDGGDGSDGGDDGQKTEGSYVIERIRKARIVSDADRLPVSLSSLPSLSSRCRSATREHLPEYLIEAALLGVFMMSAGVLTTAVDHPRSWLHEAIAKADIRRVMIGLGMGLTAIALIYSPWGKRSGAHMNPAVTLTFLRLGHVTPRDALCYMLAQFVGGTIGVFVGWAVIGAAFAEPPINFVTTVPGAQGLAAAFIAELLISMLLMGVVLYASNSARHTRYTGLYAGALVAVYISIEAPLSGMSMNPARTFASALPAGVWTSFWVYLIAPIAGMQLAAALHLFLRGRASVRCAKLIHSPHHRCIFCGFMPAKTNAVIVSPNSLSETL